MSRRQEKLSSLYRKVVSSFLERELLAKDALFSVTRVELSSDLKIARIYFSVWPDEKARDVLKSLEDLKKELRGHLGDEINSKFVPDLEFILDESEKKRLKIEGLLKKAK